MQISKERLIRSVPKYLNYVLLRLTSGYIIQDDEMRETFTHYRNFCEENSLDYLSRIKFYDELRDRGIETKSVWDRGLHRTVAVRDLNDKDTIKRALDNWVDTSAVHGSIIELDGEKYQIIIKLVKLQNYDNNKT